MNEPRRRQGDLPVTNPDMQTTYGAMRTNTHDTVSATRLGTASDWVQLTNVNGRLVGLKTDGTIWDVHLPVVHKTNSTPSTYVTSADHALLDALKAWRLDTANTERTPAFCILHNSTLEAIVANRPSCVQDLASIDGIGATKLERYGDNLLRIVSEHGIDGDGSDQPL